MAYRSRLVTGALFALALASVSISQGALQVEPESTAASAFARAMQEEAGTRLKRIHKKRVQDLCTTDARRWGDGIVGYERLTFANDQDLADKMLALVRQWKTRGSQDPSFDASDFPKLRRYSVKDCGLVGNQTKVVVAVYFSAWDSYWANWANLLGK